MGTLIGTGPSAPAVVAGETAAAQPAGSPTIPTQIAVPTPTMTARAEDVQAVALAAIDGMTALRNAVPTISTAQVLDGGIWNETPSNDGAYHDTSAVHVDFAGCKVGDIITVFLSGQITYSSASASGMKMGFRDDFSGTNVLSELQLNVSTGAVTALPLSFVVSHTVATAGTCRAVLRLSAGSLANTTFTGPGSIHGQRVTKGV